MSVAKSSRAATYASPSIVHMGVASEVTGGHNGDICDGPPCVGLYRPFSSSDHDHDHDPQAPAGPAGGGTSSATGSTGS